MDERKHLILLKGKNRTNVTSFITSRPAVTSTPLVTPGTKVYESSVPGVRNDLVMQSING